MNPATNSLKILEENHYYPFGLKHNNYNDEKLNFKMINNTVTALNICKNKEVNTKEGIKEPFDADKKLSEKFSNTTPKIGDIIRYARENGYADMDLNRDGNIVVGNSDGQNQNSGRSSETLTGRTKTRGGRRKL